MKKGLALFLKKHLQDCLEQQTLTNGYYTKVRLWCLVRPILLYLLKAAPVLAQEFFSLRPAFFCLLPSAPTELLEKITDEAANRSFSFICSEQTVC